MSKSAILVWDSIINKYSTSRVHNLPVVTVPLSSEDAFRLLLKFRIGLLTDGGVVVPADILCLWTCKQNNPLLITYEEEPNMEV
jgi:hypothetical protein